MKKAVIIFGFLVLILLAGFYARRRSHNPKYQLENTVKHVVELPDSNLIENGDIIFQTSLSQQSKAFLKIDFTN
jgi:hypothetical protein